MTVAFLADLAAGLPTDAFSTDPAVLAVYAADQGPVTELVEPLAVVWAASVQDVQHVLKAASIHAVGVIARGAGTGVSGGAHATANTVVLSLERMNRILDIRADDELAVVEPGVINAELNAAVAPHGLMYAPDPASYRMSTIGGNAATNAGGLRCAKYGVTRESVLALDVVLADGSLIHTGHDTFKGVAGYDLTGLFIGSEGTLGIIVGITVRLRYLAENVQTLAAFFPDVTTAAAGVLAIGRARVQPAILELLDGKTMEILDATMGSGLRTRGGALLLVQTDGHGAGIEAGIIRQTLSGLGAVVTAEASDEAARLIELRRHSRGAEVPGEIRVGEDVAVPRSQLVHYIRELERMAADHRVLLKVVAHAGDGNLHPTFWVAASEGDEGIARLEAALDESIDVALRFGGTITGEHGVGQYKLRWLGLELSPEIRTLQARIKELFDPAGILNPGKAI